jgi:hypothetical protein
MYGLADKLKRLPDFEVNYRFYEGIDGKDRRICQSFRPNWSYDEDGIKPPMFFPIWPEFLDSHGKTWPDNIPVSLSGNAVMRIAFREVNVPVHRLRIKLGTKGYFMEDNRRVAEAIVTRIIGLHTNEI